MSKIKNLYLPGTNKNIGYLDKDVMYIYFRYMKYLPWDARGQNKVLVDKSYPFVLIIKDNKSEKTVSVNYTGWKYNVDLKTYDFHYCEFKTPDNLDVIEMAYLYKHWNEKKKNGTIKKDA